MEGVITLVKMLVLKGVMILLNLPLVQVVATVVLVLVLQLVLMTVL